MSAADELPQMRYPKKKNNINMQVKTFMTDYKSERSRTNERDEETWCKVQQEIGK